jgi:hypothetical protein
MISNKKSFLKKLYFCQNDDNMLDIEDKLPLMKIKAILVQIMKQFYSLLERISFNLLKPYSPCIRRKYRRTFFLSCLNLAFISSCNIEVDMEICRILQCDSVMQNDCKLAYEDKQPITVNSVLVCIHEIFS